MPDEMSCSRGDVREYAELMTRLARAERVSGRSRRAHRGEPARAPDGQAAVRALSVALRSHPVHACPDREAHLDVAHRARRLEEHTARVRSRIERARGSMGLSLERIADLLTERGYLHGDRATASGRVLQRIWFDADLLAAESLSAGVWSRLSAPEVAALASGLVFESRRGIRGTARGLSGRLGIAATAIEGLWQDVTAHEQRCGVQPTRQSDFGFAQAVAVWAQGASLADALEAATDDGVELTAGDFVRWCRQVIDAVDQIDSAAARGAIPEAANAVVAIRRGVVALGAI
jgi:ATP-dependent RNA helicase HelY